MTGVKEMVVGVGQQELGHLSRLRRFKEALLESDSKVKLGCLSEADSKVI